MENKTARARRTKKYRDGLKQDGKCSNGCGQLRRPNRSLCAACGDTAKERSRRHQRDKQALGECLNCSELAVGKYCETHLKQHKDPVWKNARKVKERLFSHYGGTLCAWPGCGITDMDVLSLDHIDDNGAEERRSLKIIGGGQNFYRWLKGQGYPSGYQVLCMNHQYKKRNMKWRGESLPEGVTNGRRNPRSKDCARSVGEAPRRRSS